MRSTQACVPAGTTSIARLQATVRSVGKRPATPARPQRLRPDPTTIHGTSVMAREEFLPEGDHGDGFAFGRELLRGFEPGLDKKRMTSFIDHPDDAAE